MTIAALVFTPAYDEQAEGSKVTRLEWTFTDNAPQGGFGIYEPNVLPDSIVTSAPDLPPLTLDVTQSGTASYPADTPSVLISWERGTDGLRLTFGNDAQQ